MTFHFYVQEHGDGTLLASGSGFGFLGLLGSKGLEFQLRISCSEDMSCSGFAACEPVGPSALRRRLPPVLESISWLFKGHLSHCPQVRTLLRFYSDCATQKGLGGQRPRSIVPTDDPTKSCKARRRSIFTGASKIKYRSWAMSRVGIVHIGDKQDYLHESYSPHLRLVYD